MQGYGVTRMIKFNESDLKGIGEHTDRSSGGKCVSPPNADPERINENMFWDKNGKGYSMQEWAKFTKNNNLKTRVKNHIKENYHNKRKLRPNAVLCAQHLFTSDNESMTRIFNEGRAEEWIKANREFLSEIYGEENILSMSLHMDEKTPHLEVVVVPLHKDGSLSMKRYIDGKKDLSKLQDKYAETVKKFGLKRGVKGSGARHVHSKEVTKNTYTNEHNRN